jgi:hypothetical protein
MLNSVNIICVSILLFYMFNMEKVNNGATFVKIDKIKCSLIDEYSLVIQDDGGGMSPESLRHCMSFGFSKKSGNSSIGQCKSSEQCLWPLSIA